MNFKGHLAFGFLLSISAVFILNTYIIRGIFPINQPVYIVLSILTIFIFSLLPDIDLKNSKISRVFNIISIIGMIISGIFLILTENIQLFNRWDILSIFWASFILFIFNLIASKFKHRHFTHSYLFFIIIIILLLPVFKQTNFSLILIATTSFISHLIGDGMPMGYNSFLKRRN